MQRSAGTASAAASAQPERAEAADLRRQLLNIVRRAAKWIVAVLVVSLVLPAVTKQWSDNQQQRQLKADVASRLAAAVAQATTDGGFLLGDQIEYRGTETQLHPSFERTVATWKSEASAIEAEMAGYFTSARDPETDNLVRGMRSYDKLVQAYLGYCLFYKGFSERKRFLTDFRMWLNAMRVAVGGPRTPLVPTAVVASLSPGLPAAQRVARQSNEFKEAAENTWATNIDNASAPLIAMVNERQARGFHVGARSFIRQLIHPFG